jgi:hypothetical protein
MSNIRYNEKSCKLLVTKHSLSYASPTTPTSPTHSDVASSFPTHTPAGSIVLLVICQYIYIYSVSRGVARSIFLYLTKVI